MKIDDLYQELIDAAVAQMDAPLPPACGSTPRLHDGWRLPGVFLDCAVRCAAQTEETVTSETNASPSSPWREPLSSTEAAEIVPGRLTLIMPDGRIAACLIVDRAMLRDAYQAHISQLTEKFFDLVRERARERAR